MESNNNNNNNSNNDTSDQDPWEPARRLTINGRGVQSVTTPTVASIADKLLLVWVSSQGSLAYSVGTRNADAAKATFLDSASWSGEQLVPNDTGVSAAPVLATHDGVIHMVYPDENHNLVHLQYFPENLGYRWGRRAGLVATTDDQVSLVSFEGSLWCVYKLKNDWYRVKWTDDDGWSRPKLTKGLPTIAVSHALVVLQDRLQLLVEVKWREASQFSGTYDLNNNEDLWTLTGVWDPVQNPDTDNLGLSVASLDDRCFVASALNGKIVLRQFTIDGWQAAVAFQVPNHSLRNNTAPAVALFGNEVFCFWQPHEDRSDLQWTSRQALRIPPLYNWMRAIEDKQLVSNLTIPGTHDTAAAFAKINDYFWNVGRDALIGRQAHIITQKLSIPAQLDMGIRFFDLRCGYKDRPSDGDQASPPALIAVHDNYDCCDSTGSPLTISNVFKDIYSWMKRNGNQYRSKQTREGILLSIKLDRLEADDAVATRFSADIYGLITKEADPRVPWRLTANFPTMGGTDGLRGGIQLVRRFKRPVAVTTGDFGINVFDGDVWPKNSSGSIPNPKPPGPAIEIQDQWKWYKANYFRDVPSEKFALVQQLLELKKNDTTGALALNFATGNGFWDPRELALGWLNPNSVFFYQGVNQKLAAYFTGVNQYGQFGVIIIDFAGETDGLIAKMVATNFPPTAPDSPLW